MNYWFSDWHSFVAMGGYARQVWLCVLLLLLGLGWMLLPPLWQRRGLRRHLRGSSSENTPLDEETIPPR